MIYDKIQIQLVILQHFLKLRLFFIFLLLQISPWLFMFIIFTIVNVSLTAALITAVSLVRMID